MLGAFLGTIAFIALIILVLRGASWIGKIEERMEELDRTCPECITLMDREFGEYRLRGSPATFKDVCPHCGYKRIDLTPAFAEWLNNPD